jgi:stage IV sporulation protein FB
VSRLALRFRIAGIPVQVDPGFWMIALLLSMNRPMTIWIPAIFVSVLVHELGHAFMAKAFGAKPDITLYTMGGVTRSAYPKGQPYSRLRSALVTASGPGAGFMLAAVAFAVLQLPSIPPESKALDVAKVMIAINVLWGVMNLLPVLPLDGGNLLRALLSGPGPEVGLVRTLWASVIIGPLIAIASWRADYTWAAMLFGFFTFSSARQLLDVSRARADQKQGFDDLLEQAHQALVNGDMDRAEQLSAQVAKGAKTKMLRMSAFHLIAFVKLEQGDPAKALELLETLPPETVDPFLQGACLLALDRAADAIPPLEQAAESGQQPRAIELLLRALEMNGEHDRANELRRAVREASR